MQKLRRLRGGDSAGLTNVGPTDQAVESTAKSRLPVLWIVLSGIGLIATIMVVTAFVVDDFRQRALAGSTRELENTVLLVTRHFDESFEDVQQSPARKINLAAESWGRGAESLRLTGSDVGAS